MFVGSLDLIPDSRVLTLKLTYYEDVTPPDYEPEFFSKLTDFEKFKFNGDVLRIKIGKLTTQDHSLQVRFAHVEECIFEDTPDNSALSFLANSKTEKTIVDEIKGMEISEARTTDKANSSITSAMIKLFM